MKILVVDDYPGAADIACVLLGLLGHESRSALTGQQALEHVESFDPDVIVLDLGLPDQSGYDVARTVRSRSGRRPFIAAMTGRGAAEDRVQSLASGIDLHVLKPASAENLTRIVETAARVLSEADAADQA